jgi:hypothetical protein
MSSYRINSGFVGAFGERCLSYKDELAAYLRREGYNVEVLNNAIRVLHDTLPLYLDVEFKERHVYLGVVHGEELRSILEDLKDAGEDVEEIVESALSFLSMAALKARHWLEERGFIVVFKLREGTVEVYDMLEEILEEE